MDKMKVLRGDPVKLTLCGKVVTVKKLTISKSMDLIELWSKLTPDKDAGMKQSVQFMMQVVSFISGIKIKDLDEETTLEEITEAFGVLYKRELVPLLKGAEKFKEATNLTT